MSEPAKEYELILGPRVRVLSHEEGGTVASIEGTIEYADGYRVSVGWSMDDDAWIARCTGLKTGDVIADGPERETAALALCTSLAASADANQQWADEDHAKLTARIAALESELAALRAPATPDAIDTETPPHIWGDGIHDDTEAFRWYYAHRLPLPELPEGAVIFIRPITNSLPAFCAWPRDGTDQPDDSRRTPT